MKRSGLRVMLTVAVACLVALVVSPYDLHAGRYDELLQNPVDGDPCPEMTVEECFYSDADYANGGTAGGMDKCQAWKFCVSCELLLTQPGAVCIKSFRNDYCKCSGYTQNGVQSCMSNGACTYKGT